MATIVISRWNENVTTEAILVKYDSVRKFTSVREFEQFHPEDLGYSAQFRSDGPTRLSQLSIEKEQTASSPKEPLMIIPQVVAEFSNYSTHCESPSLPYNSLHIVVAGHQRENIPKHYLYHIGLTNVEIFFYRKEYDFIPLRTIDGQCGIKAYERLILPNYGREAVAFYDYAIEHYNNPPRAIMFLHGHAFIGDHLTCNSGFSRALKYYRDMVDNSTFDRMITLTQNPQQSDKNSNSFNWNGGYYLRRRQLSVDTIAVNSNDYRNRGQVQIENAGDSGKHSKIDRYDKPSSAEAEGGRERFNFDERKLEKEHDNVKAGKECVDVFLKNNITARAPGAIPYQSDKEWYFVWFRPDIRPDKTTSAYMRSCCPSFIMGGQRLRWYPLQFYRDMRQYFLNSNPMVEHNKGWLCFEYVIWDLFADIRGVDTTVESERQWYKRAAETVAESQSSQSEQFLKALKECQTLEQIRGSQTI